uniref:Tyrosine decarboxylase n=1 Tax=Globodera rostochiensis TaxID=31243 RepID=A0A914HFM5_GLORO
MFASRQSIRRERRHVLLIHLSVHALHKFISSSLGLLRPRKWRMVNAFGYMFQGLNKFCEEKTSKWRQNLSFSNPPSPMVPPATVGTAGGHLQQQQQQHQQNCTVSSPRRWQSSNASSSSCCSSSNVLHPCCSSTSGVPSSNFVSCSSRGSSTAQIVAVSAASSERTALATGEEVPFLHSCDQQRSSQCSRLIDDDILAAGDVTTTTTAAARKQQQQQKILKMLREEDGGGVIGGSDTRRTLSVGSAVGRRSLDEAAAAAALLARKGTAAATEGGGNGMSSSEFRHRGRQMVDYIVDYMDGIEKRRVVPSIEPGYLRELIPSQAPHQAETFDRVLQDFEAYIMPGVTHWQHPRFHAYFPAGNSFPSILADMLSDALGCMGFSWAACPAMTELEMHMLQWFGQMIGLPLDFLPFTENATGGGVIQGSASECNFVALLAARFEVMKELRHRFPFVEDGLLMSKLIAYCSKEAHSSIEKAAMIAIVKLRILETDSNFRLRGETLQTAITEDRNLGLIPFFVSTTLGTTSCCSFDVLSEIGPVCTRSDIWLHVDAAYAGSAMVCPEFRHLMAGIEHAMSFNTNPNKWMLVNFDCSTMWVKDRFKLTQALVVDPLYLQHSWTDKAIDYRHWGIPLSRRFRSLKLWFVIRMYGIEGIQRYIREHVRLAKYFESLLLADEQFEIVGDVIMGLVCFRMKASDELNQLLLTKLNSSGRIHMVPASLNERFVIRFCVCQENSTERDILIAYELIKQMALSLFEPEPIEENYELEVEEAKQYDQMMQEKRSSSQQQQQRCDSTPTAMLRSQKSLGGIGAPPNITSMTESTGSLSSSTFAPGTTPPATSNAAIDAHQQQPSPAAFHDRRRIHTLAEKRSFLVRMVSDPKCYNPKIVRHLNMRTHNQTSQDLFRDRTLRQAIEQGSRVGVGLCAAAQPPSSTGANHLFHLPTAKASQFSSGKYSYLSIDHQGSDDD